MALSSIKRALFERLLTAIDESGWLFILIDRNHPFRFRVFKDDERGFDLRAYIWQCTHGGGSARAADEYRVQLTGTIPEIDATATTLLLGWHAGWQVFVGFDIRKHAGQASSSPSIQVKEEILQNAHNNAFSVYTRSSGELAVAFRPEFLIDYALNSTSLHTTGKAVADLYLLNNLETLDDNAIVAKVTDEKRKIILRSIAQKYRAYDFRKRVLGAYEHKCAMCGVQLNLIDAAHILPVQVDGSTDETNNGVALCKLHHAAFDRALVSFDKNFKVEVSESKEGRFVATHLAGGIREFKNALKARLILPHAKPDYPHPDFIAAGKLARLWRR